MKAITLILSFLLSYTSLPAQAQPSLEQKIGQMIMLGFRGMDEATYPADLPELLPAIREGLVGGLILFEPDYLTRQPRNIRSMDQVRALTRLLQAAAPVPLFIAVDQEGGKVQRFKAKHGFTESLAPKELGKHSSTQASLLAGAGVGKQLAKAGINLNFAPSLDVDINPKSPAIGAVDRAFAAKPAQVAAHAAAFAQGLQQNGVVYCYKHFPGHGSASADSHMGLTDITHTWQPQELEPYKTLLKEDMPGMVMAGHLFHNTLDSNLPASLSPAQIRGLLRGTLGWQGVVVTDDLQMRAITAHYSLEDTLVLAVNAGVDILLVGNNMQHHPGMAQRVHAIMLDAVRSGRISQASIDESYTRIMRLKKQTIMGK